MLITTEDLLNFQILDLNYEVVGNRKGNSSSHDTTWSCNVSQWLGFGQEVVEWKNDFYLTNNSAQHTVPSQVNDVLVTGENATLHYPVLHNVFNNVAKVMTDIKFVGEHGVSSILSGSTTTTTSTTCTITPKVPDKAGLCSADSYCLVRDEGPLQILFPVEIKGRWTLRNNSLWNSTSCSSHENSATTQLYNYMVAVETKFGIITSYDVWWFAYRTSEGDFYISEAYAKDSNNPSIMECVAYLCSKGPVKCDKPPFNTTEMSLRSGKGKRSGGFDDEDENKNSKRCKRGNKDGDDDDEDAGNDKEASSNEYSNQLSNTFQLNSLLGEGRSPVYAEWTYGLAVKGADVYKQKELVLELQHELSVYDHLSKLQGVYILEVKWSGTIYGMFYGIGFSPICSTPTSLTVDQKNHLILGLRAIHKLNVLHNDLKVDNLLVDDTGKAYIIDFGFAVKNASKDLMEQEEERFAKLISQY